jgi:DNA-binding transcriptional LysR family regulator
LASEHELPLNAIRAFEAAARRGSFVEAAKDLHVTHWAIGKQIRLLEDWLGVPLFERRTRGVALTDQGADLLTDVTSALSRLTSATGRLRGPDPARRVSGVVRVNVLPSIALRWLLPRLSEFQESFSHVEVKISTTSRKLRYVGTAFDIGIRSGVEHGAGIACETLMPDRRLPVCAPRSPWDLSPWLRPISRRAAWCARLRPPNCGMTTINSSSPRIAAAIPRSRRSEAGSWPPPRSRLPAAKHSVRERTLGINRPSGANDNHSQAAANIAALLLGKGLQPLCRFPCPVRLRGRTDHVV